jgi:hypothetical protein
MDAHNRQSKRESRWSSWVLTALCGGTSLFAVHCGFSDVTPPDGGTGGTANNNPTGNMTSNTTSPMGGNNPGGGGVGQPGAGNAPIAGSTPGAGSGPVAGAGGGGPQPAGTFKNYEYTGTWPNAPMEIAAVSAGLTFTKIQVHDRFLAESCSIADYNEDGMPDVSAGRRWYQGPDFKTEHIFRGGHDDLPRAGDSPEIDTGVSDDWSDFPFDVDGDGHTDIINIANCDVLESKNPSPQPAPQPKASAYWYKNPGGAMAGTAMWAGTVIHNDVRLEQHGLVDVDGDGFPEIYGACKGCAPAETKGYYQANKAMPTAGWTFHAVTQHYEFPFGGTGWLHGLGFGDVTGDGKPDLLERGGAWVDVQAAQPNTTKCPGAGCGWIAQNLYDGDQAGNRGPSHMYAADVDGDGDGDIIAADWAHGWGLAWYEQTAPYMFTKRQFMGTNSQADITKYGPVYFSEPHALQVVDMNADGVPDIVTGKMRFAHPISYGDPDPMGKPLLVVFEGKRNTPSAANGGSVTFVPHVIDEAVGVGRQLAVGHINTDGKMDICIASKLGLYVFLGQ